MYQCLWINNTMLVDACAACLLRVETRTDGPTSRLTDVSSVMYDLCVIIIFYVNFKNSSMCLELGVLHSPTIFYGASVWFIFELNQLTNSDFEYHLNILISKYYFYILR